MNFITLIDYLIDKIQKYFELNLDKIHKYFELKMDIIENRLDKIQMKLDKIDKASEKVKLKSKHIRKKVEKIQKKQDKEAPLQNILENPVLEWLTTCTKQGTDFGAYVGINLANDHLDDRLKGNLYPSYYQHLKQKGLNPLSHRMFVKELQLLSISYSMKLKKVKKIRGVYILGLQLKD